MHQSQEPTAALQSCGSTFLSLIDYHHAVIYSNYTFIFIFVQAFSTKVKVCMVLQADQNIYISLHFHSSNLEHNKNLSTLIRTVTSHR